MNEHASVHCCGERADGKGALHERAYWHRLLLACAAMTFTVCSSLPGEAVNGEPVGGQGVFRTATCNTDFTISCDDRSQAGVVSCHMRGPKGDEGLAINVCIDGRITSGTAQTLEIDANQVRATDFGEFVCGKDTDGVTDFCVVCDTFKDPDAPEGASHCVKIVDDGGASGPNTCGAFNISDDTDGLCPAAELELQQFFSDPHLGFSIGIDGSDAGAKAGQGVGGGKDLRVCGTRSWECIDDRSLPLATGAQQVQGQQTHALIDTPCCVRLSSGSYYCSSKLTISSTCK